MLTELLALSLDPWGNVMVDQTSVRFLHGHHLALQYHMETSFTLKTIAITATIAFLSEEVIVGFYILEEEEVGLQEGLISWYRMGFQDREVFGSLTNANSAQTETPGKYCEFISEFLRYFLVGSNFRTSRKGISRNCNLNVSISYA
ncbi:unnamed protein product [Albugo candida]|uniref:Uncharacterized protein n=1 Tax=Albugo candida TaxID=65357 RepID=A0A024FXI2_9STRA|nr:unnamed protein product [Albugo candida]|eukprot:CCI11736.1 unnamed protein product [Albugo candida]